ncbi:carbohydrate-binding module family 21 protein, partial [Tulasnella calospora MUT 4182]
VKMESLVLAEDGTTLKGSVVVKNLAYDKRVAARFTMDWWQTTSEVVAKYAESVSAPPPHASSIDTTHDRFVFQVKLADVLSKIEEKTMFVAVRYNSAGREMWDNNAGANYEVKFER